MARRLSAVLLLVVLTLQACTSGASSGDDAATGAPQVDGVDLSSRDEVELPDVTTAPVAAGVPDDAEVLGLDEVTPVPLADLGSWVDAGIEDGLFTEAEGLVAALRYITGDTPADALPGVEDVATAGGTGLVRRATDVLAADDVEGTLAEELQRLVRVFSPDPAGLDAVSVPADEAEDANEEGASGTVAVAMGAGAVTMPAEVTPLAAGGLTIDLTCNDAAAVGFADVGGIDEACLAYDERTVNGHAQRVYYPRSWLSRDDRTLARTSAMDALVESAQKFNEFGRHEDVSLIFSLAASPIDAEGVQAPFDDGDACPVTVYRAAAEDGLERFKQVIAHEAFHCFQDWNFTTAPYGSHRWWLEGSAEYFSNVVYPDVDAEHAWIADFDQNSLTKPLWGMAYATTVFFQHLANNVGDQTVIDTLEQLGAAGGGSSSAGVLRGVGDMRTIFNEMVVSFMSDGIADTGGSRIRPDVPTARRRVINAEREFDFDTQPFVAHRWALDFEKKHRFVQSYKDGGTLHGFVEADKRTARSEWTLFPEEVRSTCKEDDRNYLVSTTVDEDRTFTVDVSLKEKGICDPCLLGAWDMYLQDFESAMRGVMDSVPGMPAGAGDFTMAIPGGNYYFGFDKEGRLRSQRSGLTIELSTTDGAIAFIIDSLGTGDYETDGEVLTVTDLVEQGTRVRGGFPGISIDQTQNATTFNLFGATGTGPGAGGPDAPSNASAEYTCNEDLLTIDASIGEIRFNRIEEIPEPEGLEDTDPT